MKNLTNMLSGKKTYIVCSAMFVFAFIGLMLGKLDAASAVTILLEAAAIAGLRNSITQS